MDIAMRDKQAMELAKKQVRQDDIEGNYSIEEETRKNRKGSVDVRAANEFGSHPDYIMGKKRKS